MGLFRRRDEDERIAVLRAEMRRMDEQLEVAARSRSDLAAEVDRLTGRVDEQVARLHDERDRTFTATPPPPPPPPLSPPTPPVDPGRVERIEERLTEIATNAERLDERVTNVSTELANQLTELSSDLDYVAQGLPPGSTVSPLDPEIIEARLRKQLDEDIDAKLGIELDDVRDNTERLALEQARYEIRFRQDLADLADRLRRPTAE